MKIVTLNSKVLFVVNCLPKIFTICRSPSVRKPPLSSRSLQHQRLNRNSRLN